MPLDTSHVLQDNQIFVDRENSTDLITILYIGDGVTPISGLKPVGTLGVAAPIADGQTYSFMNNSWIPQAILAEDVIGGSADISARLNENFIGPIEKIQELGDLSGNVIIDSSKGNFVNCNIVGDIVFEFNANTRNGYARITTMRIKNGGSFVITWPTSIIWETDNAPSLETDDGINLINFITFDSGVTWEAYVVKG